MRFTNRSLTYRGEGMTLFVTIVFVAMFVHSGRPAGHTLPSVRQGSPSKQESLVDADVQRAADQLLVLVLREKDNSHYPTFAKEKIDWINGQAKAGKIAILLVKDIAGTDLDSEALMASSILNGKPTIVIVQPRFKRLLVEEGSVRAPFTMRQRNNFMLALVHEAVHLTNPKAGDPGKPADRLREELRAWWEVSLNVVRPLAGLGQPMHSRFLQVDKAFRACGDRQECPLVPPIIFADATGR